MRVVAGLSLRNLQPRVWDAASPYALAGLEAVMVSWAEIASAPRWRERAMNVGMHAALGIPESVQVYLDNGAFAFLRAHRTVDHTAYATFVQRAMPDWYPIPQDFIPTPRMSAAEQQCCFQRTMDVNAAFAHDGYVPVLHIGPLLPQYIAAITADARYAAKPVVALGAIVPNLLRAPKALPYEQVLDSLVLTRAAFPDRMLHVFGLGGTATLHIAGLLGIDSADSSGWRNRAARGLVQLPGRGDRLVAELGSWRGREPSLEEWELLAACPCPACRDAGIDGLRARGIAGFAHRATHNLWTLLREAEEITQHLSDGSYPDWYAAHLDNTVYRPLIDRLVRKRFS